MTDEHYDIVILGAGSGGYACALRASQLGMSVVLIEREKLGAPVCTVAASPRRRCCTRPRWPTPPENLLPSGWTPSCAAST